MSSFGTCMAYLAALGLCVACDVVDERDIPVLGKVGGSGSPTSAGPLASGGDGDSGLASYECSAGLCWWSTTDEAGCLSAGVPTMSMAPTETEDGDVGPIYLGLAQVRLGESSPTGESGSDAWQTFGYDLDGVCSNSSSCPGGQMGLTSCKPAAAQLPFDGAACRDANFARYQPVVSLTRELGNLLGLTESAINCSLYNGRFNMILKVSGYNGEPNDNAVRLDAYDSSGFVQAPLFKCPLDDFASLYPIWLPSSRWVVGERDLTGPIETPGQLPDSKRFSLDAYVRDGYLVVFPPKDFEINLPGDNAAFPGWSMTLTESVMTGRLQRGQDETWQLVDGLFGGRLGSEDLLLSFRELNVCAEGPLSSIYRTITQFVRDGADVLADGRNDPEADCDAMSLAIAFTAQQLTPGPAAQLDTRLDCCIPDNQGKGNCAGVCGDGQRSEDERCDTAIPEGVPGACPTECPSTDLCRPGVLSGTDCQAECTSTEVTARVSGDGCCPAGAEAAEDSDCVGVCGDGAVQSPTETCDPPGTCPTSAECADAEACTEVNYVGSPATCDAECKVSEITRCVAGDGCCPAGCDNGTDGDCAPEADFEACGMVVAGQTNRDAACQACQCLHCASEVVACSEGADPGANQRCKELAVCASAAGCTGVDCYCMTTICPFGGNGPCVDEGEAAALTTSPSEVRARYDNLGYPVGRANAVGVCTAANCAVECF